MKDTRSKELVEAVTNIVATKPFFASLLFDLMEIVETSEVPTAATDGKRIYVGDWWRRLPMKQRVFVLCHEIYHVMFQHMHRAKLYKDREFGPDLQPFNPARWNSAGDYYINYLLDADNIGEMPRDPDTGWQIGLLDHNICSDADMLVDDIYAALPEDQGNDNFDEHMEPADDAPSPEHVQQSAIAAAETAKAIGKMPGHLDRALTALMEPPQRWKDLLRDLFTASVGRDDSSWQRPNRRRLALPPHVPYPGTQGYQMGACVVAIDTSGSIGQDELEAFVTELKGLLEQARPRELWVAWWDTSCVMQRIDNMDEFDPDELHPTGGGGTDYSCVEPAIADEYLDPEIVVALTDGHVGWPADFPWPHITLSTGRVDCPFGRTIKMDLAHDYV